nr:uncharacterized protein LOC110438862 isoform X1 [Danio rerio]|eukprot:XP_021328012.1 uncharacterized protein LOC110438862 isoform X1 [Danio rerio]
MADRSPLFLLLIFWTLSTGVFGAEWRPLSCSSGQTVHLPCINTVQHCRPSETTWLYSKDNQAVELINFGLKKRNSERLNLGSDCSLNISRVTTEDAGYYTCQQWSGEGGHQYGTYARVLLHVVAVSPSSSSSSSSSDICPAEAKTTTAAAVTPVHNKNPKTEKPRAASPAGAQIPAAVTLVYNTTSPQSSSAAVSVIVAVVAVFALLFSALIVWLIHNRLADDEEEDCDSSLLTSVVFSETPAEHMWKRMKYSV